MSVIDLDDFQRRVDSYFQCGQKSEPQGRIILDMMRALRELRAENERLLNKNAFLEKEDEHLSAEVLRLRAEIELVSK